MKINAVIIMGEPHTTYMQKFLSFRLFIQK